IGGVAFPLFPVPLVNFLLTCHCHSLLRIEEVPFYLYLFVAPPHYPTSLATTNLTPNKNSCKEEKNSLFS
ncbi:MAG: hypothetical protein K2G16_07565, partial [Lachnospiraceae bacterium]|nr:hypothetical protein [Lachnospiraceae bacterium]